MDLSRILILLFMLHSAAGSIGPPPARLVRQADSSNRDNSTRVDADSDAPSNTPSSSSSPSNSNQAPQTNGAEANPEEAGSLYQPPHELSVTRLSDTSVVLKWDIPYSVHEHLQFFKIQYKSTSKGADWKTDNREIQPTTKAYQINGLKPGNYFFIVSAVYDNDDNVPSKQFKYRLRARSKIPSNLMPEQKAPVIHWSQAESDYIRCKWSYDFKDRDLEYFGYLVYYRSAHAVTDFTIYNTLDESVEVAELEPDTPYEVKVVAYNEHGVSDFSEILKIKTKPKPALPTHGSANETSTTVPPPSSSHNSPSHHTTTSKPTMNNYITATNHHNHDRDDANSRKSTSTSAPVVINPISTNNNDFSIAQAPPTTTTSKPIATNVVQSNDNNQSTAILIDSNADQKSNGESKFASILDRYFLGSSDTAVATRYSIFVLLPIICLVLIVICLINCRQQRHKKDSPPSSTHDSMQFDLEINGYFKNSFPGVEEPGPFLNYSTHLTMQNAHQGFVNNHPHINEFA